MNAGKRETPMTIKFAPSLRILPLLACLVLVTGCASIGNTSSDNKLTPAPRAVSLADGSVRVDTENSEIAELWSAAEIARQSGNDPQALESLYQALELEPQNSLLWSRVAELQLDNSEPGRAEQSALRSNTFAGNNASLLHRNWLMIKHARNVRGDLLGVRSAHKQVQQYQYR